MTIIKLKLSLIVLFLIIFSTPVIFAENNSIVLGVVPHMYGDPACKDDTEKAAYCYMGQAKEVTHIITPSTKEDFANRLKALKQHGYKIEKMLIAGHGSADFPRIEFGEEYIGFKDLDKKGINKNLNDYEKIQIRNEKLLVENPNNGDAKRRLLFIKNEIDELKNSIHFIESIPSIMEEDGEIVLINCSTAANPEGIKFIKKLGAALFGNNKSGSILASTTDVKLDQAKSYLDTFFAPTGTKVGEFFYKGSWVRILINPRATLMVVIDARDDQGNPVLDSAKIEVNGPTGEFTENDLIGNFPNLGPGKYAVTASVKGFISKTKTLSISSDQPNENYSLFFALSARQETVKRQCVLEVEVADGSVPDGKRPWGGVALTAADMAGFEIIGCLSGSRHPTEDELKSSSILQQDSCIVEDSSADNAAYDARLAEYAAGISRIKKMQKEQPGTSLSGVTIEIGGPSGWRAVSGLTATFKKLPEGTYSVNAFAHGWVNAQRSVEICSNRTNERHHVVLTMTEGDSTGSSIRHPTNKRIQK